MFIELVFHN